MRSMLYKMSPLFAGWGCAAQRFVKAEVGPSLGQTGNSANRAHIYFLLDRSGSMQTIADDVIGGFNTFVKEQQKACNDSAGLDMTMVQFDSQDPQEVVFSACDITEVPLLSSSTFRPRAATPLFDAMGGILNMAEEAKSPDSEVIIVSFTDGMENASREHSKKCILAKIEAKHKEGWTFVFLGANQDSYAEGGQLGYNKANIQNFAFDSKGTKKAWEAVSMGCFGMRQKMQNA